MDKLLANIHANTDLPDMPMVIILANQYISVRLYKIYYTIQNRCKLQPLSEASTEQTVHLCKRVKLMAELLLYCNRLCVPNKVAISVD